MLFRLVLVLMSLWTIGSFSSVASASAPGDPVPEVLAGKKDRKTKEEKTEEQKKAEEEALKKKRELLARVIVLEVPGTSVGHTDETLVMNVRSRISRTEAMFFPEVDVYQNGRKLPDRTVAPPQQPAIVPDSAIDQLNSAVAAVEPLTWDSLDANQWAVRAHSLRAVTDEAWFIDRVELREPLFRLYAQIGRAAEYANTPTPPFYVNIGNIPVPYYWYLAALLANQDPSLMQSVTDQETLGGIKYQLQQIRNGAYPSYKGDFQRDNSYSSEDFTKTYELFVNGIPMEPDGRGQIDLFLGVTDVYLKRKDTGHGLTERLTANSIDDKTYFFMEMARKRIGADFIDQLMLNKNDCMPDIDGDILAYLAIYQKMHSKADIFIAIPENGNPNQVWIWRYMRDSGQLKLVGGGPDNFPVRFAFLFSSGILFNGAAYSVEVDNNLEDESSLAPKDLARRDRISESLDRNKAVIPFDFELRGHFNRLMVNFGAEWGLAAGSDENFVEYFQTPGKQGKPNQGGDKTYNDVGAVKGLASCKQNPEDGKNPGKYTCDKIADVYNIRRFNRDIYLGAGVVLGPNAGIGFGPRFAWQWGWVNMPHGYQTTLHFGYAWQPPVPQAGGRVRPLIDFDIRGGVGIPVRRSLRIEAAEALDESRVQPVFGANLGIGLTF
ncbi:MAG TPA: hypothetical protein DFR83_29135 [Deltaproteobacteria bacterium]|nr:hypothetical protein [Deltaproteobacteria bacterium]